MPATIGYAKPIQKRLNKDLHAKLKRANELLVRGMGYRAKIRESKWRESMAQYEGDNAWSLNRDDPTADLVSVNISFSTINTLIPFVADENPSFKIHPYSGDATEQNAQLLEHFLNRLWQSNDVQGTRAVRDASFDWLVLGDGYAQVSYEIDEQPIMTEVGDKVPNDVEIAEFSVDRVNPWDIWLDPYSDGIYNARWVCKRLFVPREVLENDERYTMPKDVNLAGIDTRNLGPGDEDRLQHNDSQEWVTLYEFYDLTDRWMLTFTEGGQTVVRYIEHLDCPIVQIPNYRIPNSPYHMGELEQIAPLQDELNKTRSQMITHRRRNVAKWIVRENALSEDAEQALKSSKVNDVIAIRSNDPFSNIILPVHAIPLAADAYQIDEQIRSDINEVTGVNEYLRGAPQGPVRTATESTIIEGATNIRTRHKLLQVETASQQIGQLLLDIMTDVLPLTNFEEMSLYVTGREAERLNQVTGQEDIQQNSVLTPLPEIFEGKYEVRVERGSTELRNPEAKENKLKEQVQMMLTATPVLMQLGIAFNIKRLMEMWFEASGIADVDALFEPDEEQAVRQQLSLQQQALEASGQAGPGRPGTGAPSQIVGGTATGPGEPRPATAQAPSAVPTPANSGILAPQ